MLEKFSSDSFTEQVHLVNLSDLNGSSRLFGGVLLSWIDQVAGIVAMRHSGRNITTVFIDRLHFIRPAYANDLVVVEGKVVYTGNTSMEVEVLSFVEDRTGEKQIINKAYVVMVAIDENGKPTSVPRLIPKTEEEKAEFERGRIRQEERKKNSV